MPTYTYKCESCGYGQDEWLKMSEAQAERVCPSCSQPTYRKQITAPAFHLKGGGWYASDFRDKGCPAAKPDAAEAAPAQAGCGCAAAATCPAAQAAAASTADSAN